MTVAHEETTGGCGGDREGLPAGAPNARTEAVPGRITARWQANARLLEPGKGLSISGTVVESSKRPTMAVGTNRYGKSLLSR